MMKHSRQRDCILTYLQSTREHPTADTIYAAVRKECENISLGTVYRNLAQLEQIGQVQKLTVQGHPDHYDATVTPHYHFICDTCDRVLDVDFHPDGMRRIDQEAEKEFGGDIRGHVCYFYGTCPQCKKKHSA